jgi:hypothetical protein
MDLEEMRTGVANNRKNLSFAEALAEPLTRAEYIRREILGLIIVSVSKEISSAWSYLIRSPKSSMVDRGVHENHHAIHEEDALWDSLYGARDALRSKGMA